MTDANTNAQLEVRPVTKTITVAAPQERAFRVFTEKLGTWWPKDYSIGEADMADFILEPKAGGRWYEVGVDGVEYEVGRVLAYEPPRRVVIAWHLNHEFIFDPDPQHASEVEVTFVADDDRTRVELEHRAIERHGDGAQGVFAAVFGPNGWGYVLDHYIAEIEA